MKKLFALLLGAACALPLAAQSEKPPYCDEGPSVYGNVVGIPGASQNAPPLPRFASTPTNEYKVQVAILKYTDPREYPFHPALVARYRPCEQVWVVESRESFANRADAERLQGELKGLGYGGAYITDLVAYQ